MNTFSLIITLFVAIESGAVDKIGTACTANDNAMLKAALAVLDSERSIDMPANMFIGPSAMESLTTLLAFTDIKHVIVNGALLEDSLRKIHSKAVEALATTEINMSILNKKLETVLPYFSELKKIFDREIHPINDTRLTVNDEAKASKLVSQITNVIQNANAIVENNPDIIKAVAIEIGPLAELTIKENWNNTIKHQQASLELEAAKQQQKIMEQLTERLKTEVKSSSKLYNQSPQTPTVKKSLLGENQLRLREHSTETEKYHKQIATMNNHLKLLNDQIQVLSETKTLLIYPNVLWRRLQFFFSSMRIDVNLKWLHSFMRDALTVNLTEARRQPYKLEIFYEAFYKHNRLMRYIHLVTSSYIRFSKEHNTKPAFTGTNKSQKETANAIREQQQNDDIEKAKARFETERAGLNSVMDSVVNQFEKICAEYKDPNMDPLMEEYWKITDGK